MTVQERRLWWSSLDEKAGDGIETLLRRHHERRLRKIGWGQALDPGETGWWSAHAAIRHGNHVEVMIDGAEALAAMHEAIRGAKEYVHIAGWHATPDFRLTREPGAVTLRELLAETARRVPVRLLLWAGPPLPVFQPTRAMVREAKRAFEAGSGVQCALDSRERTLHCHHEKIVVVDGTVAFVGGLDFTDLQGDRHDHQLHPPRGPLGWHDAAVRLHGPAVADVARHFALRWGEVTGHVPPIPSEHAQPSYEDGVDVQVLRTVPEGTYTFAPHGEFTILDAYLRALRSAERFIYLENQFLWSPEVVDVLADRLEHPPCDEFRILLLLPTKPSNGSDTTRGQIGRLLDADARGKRLLATTLSANGGDETSAVYVHAKIGIVDDRWLTIGSGNLNEHSLFNDTEMNVLMDDADLVRRTRLRLWAEHTERAVDEIAGEPCSVIDRVWRPIAEGQAELDEAGLERTHRLTLLPRVSRRVDRLQGPVRGLLVDG